MLVRSVIFTPAGTLNVSLGSAPLDLPSGRGFPRQHAASRHRQGQGEYEHRQNMEPSPMHLFPPHDNIFATLYRWLPALMPPLPKRWDKSGYADFLKPIGAAGMLDVLARPG